MPNSRIKKLLFTIPQKKAGQIIITLSCLALCYHVLIISGVIPFKYVWGGRIESREQLWGFEVISTVLNVIIIYTAASGSGLIKSLFSQKFLTALLWFFAGLLLFNTIGNLVAEEFFEMIIFTPLTLLMSILFTRLAIEKGNF